MSVFQQHQQAIDAYDAALDIKPDLHEALTNKGSSLHKLGRYQDAIDAYDAALDIKPDLPEALFNKGSSLHKLGRYQDAIDAYDAALDIKPDKHDALSNKGISLDKLGRYQDAIDAYDAALDIKPDLPEALFNKGISLHKLGRYQDAIDACDAALDIKPDDHEALSNKGNSLHKLGRYQDAIDACDAALAIKPDKHEAWCNRGNSSGKALQHTRSFLSSLSLSPIPIQHPELKQRGYPGQLACYQVGLQYVQQETDPFGWGQLHRAAGHAHYFYDRYSPTQLRKALMECDQALTTLTAKDYPIAHLETLQLCLRAHLGLNHTDPVRTLRKQALTVLQNLLNQAESDSQRRRIETQFFGLSHLQVDLLLAEGLPTEALLAAERYKNRVLTWILDHWQPEGTTISPSLDQIRSLISPQTAILYWHLSEDTFTTFVLTDNAPITATTQPSQKLETWLKTWTHDYSDYRTKGKHPADAANDRKTHPWRTKLPNRLDQLNPILDINKLTQNLANIQNLILIPHRHLHRLPLHTLFPTNLTTTYLPSAQIGLTRPNRPPTATAKPLLIEPPIHEGLASLTTAELEIALIAQLCKTHGQTPNLISQARTSQPDLTAQLHQPHSCLHFSGHAAYDPHQPENSALALKGTDRLTAKAIAALNLAPYDLITLSACETAITGTETITTDYVGLVSAFLKAGAAQVLSTLWTVESRSSTWLMLHFYQAYLTGTSASIALQQAQKWLRTSTSDQIIDQLQTFLTDDLLQQQPLVADDLTQQIKKLQNLSGTIEKPYADPYYWAAFTLTGSPAISHSSRLSC